MADDIGQWLEQLSLGQYAQAFADNDIDLEVLSELTDADLKDLGLTLGHRRKLLKAVASLQRATAVQVGAMEATSPPAPPEAERRQLTVLFCDLVGSTELAANLDPEDMREVLCAYQDACSGVIARYDGYVAKFMGDGVYAYFGYPRAHEDDAERAINASLGIVEAVSALEGDLKVRIGVATGTVAVGDIVGKGASEEAAIVGDAPNLAGRLQELAEPNTVVISEGTQRLAGGMFETEDLGRRALKGFSEPVGVWSVARPRPTESRFEAIRGEHLTELVGREEEMETLLRRWERAKAGEGQVVLITGEPGIGKSRLVHAFGRAIAGERHLSLPVQCSPYHPNSAMHPIIRNIERRMGLAPDDTREARLDKLEAWIAAGFQEPAEVAPVVGPLLGIETDDRYPPLDVSPQRRRELLFEALNDRLTAVAAAMPCLIVVEDAHWADPTSLELLALHVERARGAAALIIVTYRPEFAAPWVGEPHTTLIALNRFTRAECAMLAAQVGRDVKLSAEIIDRIAAQADGVPLFVEELTKSVMESTAGSAESPAAINVPATLKDSLEARLDRLGPAKEIAQVGAAIGRTFDYGLLSRLLAVDDRVLDRLVRSELVTVRGTPPEATYTFRHALIQDTAYGSLLRSRRAGIHELIAKALEQDRPDIVSTQPEVLAYHFTAAGDVGRGADYWLGAGQESLRRSGIAEAIAHLRKGLEVLEDRDERGEYREREIALWVALASTLRPALGPGHVEVEQAYAKAYALCREAPSTEQLFPVLYGLFHSHYMRGDLKAAEAEGEELLRLAGSDPERVVVASAALCEYHVFSGNNAEAVQHGKRAAEAYDIAIHPGLAVTYGREFGVVIQAASAIAQVALGYPDQARQIIQNLIAHGQAVKHPYAIVFSRGASAIPSILLRDIDTVLECSEEGGRLATEQGFSGFQALCGVARGWVRATRNPSADALSEIQDGIEKARITGNDWIRPLFACLLGEAKLRTGRTADALDLMDGARSEIDKRGASQFQSIVLCTKADALLALDDPDQIEAERCYLRAIDVARSQSARFWELRAATRLARLWHSQGKITEARELLAPVYGWFTEGFDTADLQEAKALLNELN